MTVSRKYLLVNTLLLLIFFQGMTQGFNIEAVKEYNKLYRNMLTYTNNAKGVNIRYNSVSVKNGIYGQPLTNEIKMQKDRFHFQNRFFDYYQDQQQQVAIFVEKKEIIINDLIKLSDPKASYEKIMQLISVDTLRKYCSSLTLNKGENQKNTLIITYNKETSKQLGIHSIQITYSLKEYLILQKETIMIPIRGNHYKDILTIEFLKKELVKTFSGTAVSQIYKSGNLLKPKYKEFQVKDLRKK